MNQKYRIGFGFDVHQLSENRRCVIGGVEIKSALGILGHSDADVLSHAIADSILGAASLPDIGYYFPNTSDAFKDMNSQDIIKKAVSEIEKLGYKIGNIDCTIISETPKIMPHIAAMKKVLAKSLKVEECDVGIKATTNEKMGFIGRKEGIAAHVVCLITKVD